MELQHIWLSLDARLNRIYGRLPRDLPKLQSPYPGYALFFSVSDGTERARVIGVTAETVAAAWGKGVIALRELCGQHGITGRWLRVDWIDGIRPANWGEVRSILARTKRNYFRCGLALDSSLTHAFTEQELNANAMLYGGNQIFHAIVNEKNFSRYARQKYETLRQIDFGPEQEAHIFTTCGYFCDENGEVLELNPAGLDGGRRRLEKLIPEDVHALIATSSAYLARQVKTDGLFHYGWHPCFDRPIGAYNTLRHASTIYAMVEALEVTQDETLRQAVDRSLACLTGTLIRRLRLEDGSDAAFLVDEGNQIKLGGNAVAILALVKHASVTGDQQHLSLAQLLARGIRAMQDSADGSFIHVLNFPDLSVRDRFRTIYYDGEAAFGLLRLYDLVRDPELLETVERAFGHFIEREHWRHHDHWLSYSVNELTRYRPEEKYFRFGVQNVAGHLDFVSERITTFPTLLELMMAAEEMLRRLTAMPEYRHLLDELDQPKFHRALEKRAHYLLNGHFWPELAMYYQNPRRIVGSFFIRHHAFRVRIDDVEHYLSGFVAYRKYLQRG